MSITNTAVAKTRMSGRAPASASSGNWVAPMLATLSHGLFSREGWLFEPKLDGIRCLVSRSDDDVELLSRNQKRLNAKYPELVEAFRSQPSDSFAVDGEIVAVDGGHDELRQVATAHVTGPA
jgi:ATP-dependent DNA ligase